MSFIKHVSVLILTRNEEANISRTLRALSRFPDILVLDSGSDDATREIVMATPNARLATRQFDAHAAQWNYGLSLLSKVRPWVLALDADYVLTDQVVDEIDALCPDPAVSGYSATFRYCIQGKPLRGSLYPEGIVLFRRAFGRYVQKGHTHRLEIACKVLSLTAQILHDDRKPLSRWFEAQSRYSRLEAQHIVTTPHRDLRRIDRLRRLAWIMPLIVLPYTLLAKRCFLDGWRGWFYALQRLVAETMICLALLDLRLNPAKPKQQSEKPGARSE